MNTPHDLKLAEEIDKLKTHPPIRPHTVHALGEHLYGRHVVVAVVATHCGMAFQILRTPTDWTALSHATGSTPGTTAKVIELYPSIPAATNHLATA